MSEDCPCEDETKPSLCDCDKQKNLWFEGENTEKGIGCCLLDTMTEEQVIYTLTHNPFAARDLLKITTNARLRELAETVGLLPSMPEGDRDQAEVNRNQEAGANPFYAYFRGQPPFAQ
jgi:hypothetical protein